MNPSLSTHNAYAPESPVVQERKIVTTIPGPRSEALHEARKEVVPPGVHSVFPVYIDRAHGSILVDIDGNQFIDCAGGIGVTTIGHTDGEVVEAAKNALDQVTHTLFTVTPYESYVRVAQLLAQLTPGSFAKRTLLVNSGAEAVENGVKIARKFTGKPGVAVLDHAYHGRTILTMAMNYKAAPYSNGFGPAASSVYHVPNSYPFADKLSGDEAADRTIEHLEKIAGAENLACLVVEPIQGEGGFIVPADGYLPRLLAWCRANNVVFISDEIQCGIARSGTVFASEQFGIEPDIILSAKALAGGMPLAAVTGRAEVMDAAHPGGLGGTFGGNPVSCAAAIAVLEQIEPAGLLAEAKRIEQSLGAGLLMLQQKYDIVADVRGRGAMLAMELMHVDSSGAYTGPNAEAVAAIIAFAFQRGVILLSAGASTNVLRFLPSLRMTDELIADVLTVLDDALASLS